MKIGLYFRVLFVAFLVETVFGNVRLQRSPQQYCGSRLADIMKLLCQTKYNEGKRSPMDMEIWDYKDLEDYNSVDYQFESTKQDASKSFVPSRSLRGAKKTKIIEECCIKPCFISELRGYCAEN